MNQWNTFIKRNLETIYNSNFISSLYPKHLLIIGVIIIVWFITRYIILFRAGLFNHPARDHLTCSYRSMMTTCTAFHLIIRRLVAFAYIYVCICIMLYMGIYVYIYVCVYGYVYMCICVCIDVYVYMCVYVCVCMYNVYM